MGGCLLRLTQMWSAVERKRRDIYSICGLGKDAGFERKAPSTSSSSGNSKKGGWKREGGPLRTVLAGGREGGLLALQGERGASKRKAMAQTKGGRGGGARKSIGGGGRTIPSSFLFSTQLLEGKCFPTPSEDTAVHARKKLRDKELLGNDGKGKS